MLVTVNQWPSVVCFFLDKSDFICYTKKNNKNNKKTQNPSILVAITNNIVKARVGKPVSKESTKDFLYI